ncbi:hypothetical protein A5643_06625 [Mycobacterium sp. 1274756.6]|nr:hypothetical protein A5643_06625 [Mycobacterium sp. 1274756.6]
MLRYIRDSRGADFTGYKRASLMHRARHRMSRIGPDSLENYLDVLHANSDEFAALFDTILINVTRGSSATSTPGRPTTVRVSCTGIPLVRPDTAVQVTRRGGGVRSPHRPMRPAASRARTGGR